MDVVAILRDRSQPRKYWNDLKKRLKIEGSELSEKIGQLKMSPQKENPNKTKMILRCEDFHKRFKKLIKKYLSVFLM